MAHRFNRGGRLIYVGAGTSGRLGVLDASECPPTFGVPADLVQGIIAGGPLALTTAIEGAEDDPEAGREAIREHAVGAADVVAGIAASGRTPYVVGALEGARSAGAFTVGITNVANAALSRHADVTLAAVTGPEPLTGSTRLNAGTAQKLVLNLISTGAMVRIGKAYGNLMVDLKATNTKLRDRAIRIVVAAAGASRVEAEAALEQTGWAARPAIVMLACGVTVDEAVDRLAKAHGWVRAAIGGVAS